MTPTEIRYEQEMHCCGLLGDQPSTLRLEAHDGGGGYYLVLQAHEWALGNKTELEVFISTLRQHWDAMVQARNETEVQTDKETL